jgi:hypothetical protein
VQDSSGKFINGTKTFKFELVSGNTLIYSPPEWTVSLPVVEGLFSASLPVENNLNQFPFADDIRTGANVAYKNPYRLRITVDGTVQKPDREFAAVPYSFIAEKILTTSTFNADVLTSPQSVRIGSNPPVNAAFGLITQGDDTQPSYNGALAVGGSQASVVIGENKNLTAVIQAMDEKLTSNRNLIFTSPVNIGYQPDIGYQMYVAGSMVVEGPVYTYDCWYHPIAYYLYYLPWHDGGNSPWSSGSSPYVRVTIYNNPMFGQMDIAGRPVYDTNQWYPSGACYSPPAPSNILVSGGGGGSYSDLKLKRSVATIVHPLEKVEHLQLVNYTLIKNNQKSIGYIANDVLKVVPEAVVKNGEYYGLNYGSLAALTVESVKAQQNQLTQAAGDLDLAQQKINELKLKIKQYKKGR